MLEVEWILEFPLMKGILEVEWILEFPLMKGILVFVPSLQIKKYYHRGQSNNNHSLLYFYLHSIKNSK